MSVGLTEDDLYAITERVNRAAEGEWVHNRVENEIYCGNRLIAKGMEYSSDAEFIMHARQDILRLLAEVDRLTGAIDSAISFLPDGETRLANRRLCETIGLPENIYGFFGED